MALGNWSEKNSPLKISRILHAGYIFECNNSKIAFDPLFENPFSQNCYAFPEIQFDIQSIRELDLDAIFISHYHDDHFSLESLNLLNREIPIYIFTIFEELVSLLKDLGFKSVHTIQLEKPITIGPFEVLPLAALDEDVDSIYHIKAHEKNVLHVVDSWIRPSTQKKLLKTKWDLILWPFQTMREIEVISPRTAAAVTHETTQLPPEWIEQIEQLNPQAIVPSSCQFKFEDWSWYNKAFFPISYKEFEKQIQQISPQIQVYKMSPSESLILEGSTYKKGERLSWILPLGDQNADYEFDPNVTPQSISEMAKKFPALTEKQKLEVKKYCSQKVQAEKSRNWKLIVYDDQGTATIYENKLFDEDVWLTEISETKLWKALNEGESLTSIYIRVTPTAQIDPMEDPLIHCLYDGIIGGYQKAQLKRLHTL